MFEHQSKASAADIKQDRNIANDWFCVMSRNIQKNNKLLVYGRLWLKIRQKYFVL